jgi:hypothetical protein
MSIYFQYFILDSHPLILSILHQTHDTEFQFKMTVITVQGNNQNVNILFYFIFHTRFITENNDPNECTDNGYAKDK